MKEYYWDCQSYHEGSITGPVVRRTHDENDPLNNGPVCVHYFDATYYYLDGMAHRTDGPARFDYDGDTWWYKGNQINCSSQEEFDRLIKLKAFW